MAIIPFDDRDGFIWFDGDLIPWRDAKIHVLNHGLHYASCVFEGERIYDGKVFKLAEHSRRLVESARLLGMKLPYSAAEVSEATDRTVAANNMVNGYARPVVWRGSEMMAVAAQAARIHMAIAVWQWPSYWSPEARMQGIRLDISEWRRPHPQTAPTQAKASGLYMIGTLSKHTAEAAGYDDSLLLDWRGQIAEASGANIFFVFDGEVHTPIPDCFLNGITRQTVMDLVRARGLKLVERAIMPEEMARAGECFLTGSAAELTPVREIGPYTFTPGAVTRQLIADYDALVRA
ncbi:branched-chain amino acid aminotransferase [Magnetospirillum sp. 15-1]|uniref:branched-chain amino acid aminotransferase n=1 Tax=Magnetospirillum sp. 15-1 TaxID=1979370 RepID=UPI000BBCC3BF|nr:branched-chain amino acid aminotransferase [Magnetospirillum sp. 15-1]